MRLRLHTSFRTVEIPSRHGVTRPRPAGMTPVRLTRRSAEVIVRRALRYRRDAEVELRRFLRREAPHLSDRRMRTHDLPQRMARVLTGRTAWVHSRVQGTGGPGRPSAGAPGDGASSNGASSNGASGDTATDGGRSGAGREDQASQDDATFLEIAYCYPDGTPVAEAPFTARFDDGATTDGRLGPDGTARLDGLSPERAGSVSVQLGESPRPYAEGVAPDAVPNPHYRGPRIGPEIFGDAPMLASTDAVMAPTAADRFAGRAPDGPIEAVVDWLWGVLLGDFAEDPSTSQIVTGAIVTAIPVIDQMADVRDVCANLYRLRDEQQRADLWNWLALVVTLLGMIPVVGSIIKGVLKLLLRGMKTGARVVRKQVIDILHQLPGDPEDAIRRHLSDGMAGTAKTHFRDVMGTVRSFFSTVADACAGTRVGQAAARTLRELQQIEAVAGRKIEEAAARLRAELREALGRGTSDMTVRGETGGRIDAEADVADAPALDIGYRPHPDVDAPRVGSRIHKRDHPDGPANDPYTLQPDGLPMGARRGELPNDLRGMKDVPIGYDRALDQGWPDLEFSDAPAYQNFLDAVPVQLQDGTNVIINGEKRTLRDGDKIYRIIDERAKSAGAYWTFNLPTSKTKWREDFAVKDGWNDNGYYVEYEIPESNGPKAWVGETAGQEYDGGNFYLPGGKTQIMMTPGSVEPSKARLTNWPEE